MTPDDLHASLAHLFRELTHGAPANEAYMLNPGDAGLLRALDRLTAQAASTAPAAGAASVAAHVDHICYGLELLLRWSDGEANPWSTADWVASWTRTTVDDAQWTALRDRLRRDAERWHAVLQTPRPLSQLELNGVIASVAHLAYHIGAIRQIERSTSGPRADER
jgi:hypothetical protein